MYREGGRPLVSPKIMVLISILQYIERLSDRAAAHNLRYRLDWKIALGVEVDFAGIHPTTLVAWGESGQNFRDWFPKVIRIESWENVTETGMKFDG